MKNDFFRSTLSAVLRKNWKILIALVLVVLGVVAASLIPPQILRTVIDGNLLPLEGTGLLRLGLWYFAVILLIGVLDFFKGIVLTVFGQKITKAIRNGMMEKMARMNALYFSKNGTGAIVSRFTNDVDAINTMFTNGIVGMMIDLLKVVGIVVSIWIFDPGLGLIALGLLPFIFLITRTFQKKMLKAQIQNRILVGKVNNHLTESLKNAVTIKAASKETYMESRYAEELEKNYLTVEKINFYDSIYPPIIQTSRAIVIALVVTLSAPELGWVGVTIGMVAASVDLISDLFQPIENLGMELQNIQQSISGIERVNAFWAEAEDEQKNAELTAESLISDRGNVTLAFQNVSFGYEEGTEVLQNITVTVHPREKVTFTGRTGVGKTTLFKLCMGLLKPMEGTITLNGIDVCRIPNGEKRKLFGYVDQSFHLIQGTVADQISLQDPSITQVQIERAMDFVGMSAYVQTLEKGLDTEVTNETLFSQGQKQLLAIARAIVTDPPILLLDEMTANLDSLTEENITSVLQKAGNIHTILTISHRLSSMIACDTVVILENGRIKTAGSPAELLATDEWFKNRLALEKLTWN